MGASRQFQLVTQGLPTKSELQCKKIAALIGTPGEYTRLYNPTKYQIAIHALDMHTLEPRELRYRADKIVDIRRMVLDRLKSIREFIQDDSGLGTGGRVATWLDDVMKEYDKEYGKGAYKRALKRYGLS